MVFALLTGILSHNDGDGDENMGLKVNSRSPKLTISCQLKITFIWDLHKATGVRKENNV